MAGVWNGSRTRRQDVDERRVLDGAERVGRDDRELARVLLHRRRDLHHVMSVVLRHHPVALSVRQLANALVPRHCTTPTPPYITCNSYPLSWTVVAPDNCTEFSEVRTRVVSEICERIDRQPDRQTPTSQQLAASRLAGCGYNLSVWDDRRRHIAA